MWFAKKDKVAAGDTCDFINLKREVLKGRVLAVEPGGNLRVELTDPAGRTFHEWAGPKEAARSIPGAQAHLFPEAKA